jgi:twitching motility protein PilT
LLDALLADCVRQGASDLHLAPQLPPYLRVHGILEPIAGRQALSAPQTAELAAEISGGLDAAPLTETGSLDGAIGGPDGTRFRFNVFRRQGEYSVAIRRLEDSFRSLNELGLPESLYKLCDLPDGLVLVAGPTGSGKSTTLATLLDRINCTRRCHVVTIEDPIEYIHRSRLSLVNQRQIGSDASNFHDALVASLRQDPDVVLVGEVRDLATIRTAITAAETGHLVFTTVHAGDCVGAIERLVSVFGADEQNGIRRQLALVLRAVIAQHLIVADGDGPRKQQSRVAERTAESAALPGGGSSSGLSSQQAASADLVDSAQQPPVRRGRAVTSEILWVNPAVANLIATAKSNQIYSTMESGTVQGMQTLEQDLARLWTSGIISETAAMALARNPALLRDRVARVQQRSAAASRGGARHGRAH